MHNTVLGSNFSSPISLCSDRTQAQSICFCAKGTRISQTPQSPLRKARGEFHCRKLMTFPAEEMFTTAPTTTPCQLHGPANSSPICERVWASDGLRWQTVAAHGGSAQKRHGSDKGHHSQSGHTVSKYVRVNLWPMIRRAQFQWKSTGRDERTRALRAETFGQIPTDIKKASEQANHALGDKIADLIANVCLFCYLKAPKFAQNKEQNYCILITQKPTIISYLAKISADS